MKPPYKKQHSVDIRIFRLTQKIAYLIVYGIPYTIRSSIRKPLFVCQEILDCGKLQTNRGEMNDALYAGKEGGEVVLNEAH
jgi:hypothetical protein